MYNLTDEEFEKYTSNWMFRSHFETGYRTGLTKEEVLSRLAIMLLQEKEDSDRKRVEEMMLSTRPHMLLTK